MGPGISLFSVPLGARETAASLDTLSPKLAAANGPLSCSLWTLLTGRRKG